MSGKGSRPRPFSVTQEEFGNNFDMIFGKNRNGQRTEKESVPEYSGGDSQDKYASGDGDHSQHGSSGSKSDPF